MPLFEELDSGLQERKEEAYRYLNAKEDEAIKLLVFALALSLFMGVLAFMYGSHGLDEAPFLFWVYSIIAVLSLLGAFGCYSDIRKYKKQREMVYRNFEAIEHEVQIDMKRDQELQEKQAKIQADHEAVQAAIHAYDHPTCPMCKSNNTRRISTMNRAVSVAAVGLASSKIGKQYECFNCKHKW